MGKASRKKKSAVKAAEQQFPTRTAPNWLLFGLALMGMGLTAYLTVSAWRGQALAGCTAGSACDIVLSSQWSKLFGLPTSFWGFLAYASLAGVAFIRRADIHWKLAWILSLFGVLYSAYLTGVSLLQLEAACPYCLSSLALMVVILGVTAYQRPASLSDFSWTPWLFKTVSTGVVIVLALHLYYAGIWGGTSATDDPQIRALAEHLTKIDAKFYGASWCPHCREQKEMFGASADRLPYIECSPGGPKAPQAPICQAMRIETYPTWVINGRRYEGVLTPGQLATYSGFAGERG